MTPAEIAALRALDDAATPGPWTKATTIGSNGETLVYVESGSGPIACDLLGEAGKEEGR